MTRKILLALFLLGLVSTASADGIINGGGGGPPSGAAGGDLSGTYPNPGVAKIAGTAPGTGVVTAIGNSLNAAGGLLGVGATAGGDLSGTLPSPTVAKVNGNTPGGSCGANTFASSLSSSAVPTCTQPASTNLSDAVTDTAWTPTDASGAALTFTAVTARYTKVGKMVTAIFRVTYPSTGSALAATIGGLPANLSSNFTASTNVAVGACFSGLGTNSLYSAQMQAGSANITFINNSATGLLNSTITAGILSCQISYVSQ